MKSKILTLAFIALMCKSCYFTFNSFIKEITIILFLIVSFINNSIAQSNLVPNPSFEEFTNCPSFNGGNTNSLNFWDININTADYYNSCDSIYPNNYGVPANVNGYQCANTGNGYAGIEIYGYNFGLNDVREMIGGALTNSLTIGQRYYISFFVSTAELGSYSASNQIGLRFTNSNYINSNGAQIILPPPFVDNFSHIHEIDVINDSIKWVKVEGSFIADSTYSNFIIGCFYSSNNIDSAVFQGFNYCKSYYYLDDVCISTDSSYCKNIKKQVIDVTVDSNQIFENSCVNFSVQTIVDYDSFQWQFSGGIPNSSIQTNPNNICYFNAGNYDVVLIGYKNGGCMDTLVLEDFIHVDSLNTSLNNAVSNEDIKVNYSSGFMNITGIYKEYNYSITDVKGIAILSGNINKTSKIIDCKSFKSGTYFFTLLNSQLKTYKFIINN